MTVLDLISGSMRIIGVLATNETPTATEANHALQSLNDMLDSWTTQQLMLFSKVTETFPFVSNQQIYQMGSGAPDFNTPRPQKIENAMYQQNVASAIQSLVIEIINQDQWTQLTVPNTQSNIPTKLFVNYTFPYATLYFWPVPLTTNNLVLWSWKPLTDFAALTTTVNLPPGYNKALKYNLACELAPEYGKQLDPIVIAQAVDSRADLKRMNIKNILLQADPAVIPHKPQFNWLTGE